MDVARAVFGVAIVFGAFVILLTLLNRRDRRASRLRHTVLDQLALPQLRGRIGVHIQCAVLSWRRAVIVDLLAGTPYEVWNIFIRLASRLPPRRRVHRWTRNSGRGVRNGCHHPDSAAVAWWFRCPVRGRLGQRLVAR
jgi:hypothetical protein